MNETYLARACRSGRGEAMNVVNAGGARRAYDPTSNLAPNTINRYAIGNRAKGLKSDADGSLTIYLQCASPESGKESDWLPSPSSGPFFLVLRTYIPGREIVEQKWTPPAVTCAGG